jgi:hypothetical protein
MQADAASAESNAIDPELTLPVLFGSPLLGDCQTV